VRACFDELRRLGGGLQKSIWKAQKLSCSYELLKKCCMLEEDDSS